MIRRFTITSTQFEGKLTLAYNEDDILTGFFNEAVLLDHQVVFLHRNFPMGLPMLERLVANSTTLTLTETTIVPDFARFWTLYAYKVGNKPKVEKLWNGLDNDEKCKAVDSIPSYESYLRLHPNMEKLYPQTYLSQKRFETDFKALTK